MNHFTKSSLFPKFSHFPKKTWLTVINVYFLPHWLTSYTHELTWVQITLLTTPLLSSLGSAIAPHLMDQTFGGCHGETLSDSQLASFLLSPYFQLSVSVDIIFFCLGFSLFRWFFVMIWRGSSTSHRINNVDRNMAWHLCPSLNNLAKVQKSLDSLGSLYSYD